MASDEDRTFLKRVLETSLRLGLILALVIWCLSITGPFVEPIAWGIILAIATEPVYAALQRSVGGRGPLAAAILVVAALLVLIVPAVLLTTNAIESATFRSRWGVFP